MKKRWQGVMGSLTTLAAVFVFYAMLAASFGVDLRLACALSAAGTAAIAYVDARLRQSGYRPAGARMAQTQGGGRWHR